MTARQRFRELNEFLDGLPTLVYDGPFSAHLQDRKPEGLSGPSVSEEQAVQACLDFLGKKPGTKAGFRVSGTQLISLPFETYAITLSRTDAAPGAPPAGSSPALRAAAPGPGDVSVAVSKVGGKVLWMMDDAAVSASPATSRDDAVRVAREFLVKLGFGEMEPTSTLLSEGNVLAISFVPVRNGTLLYAEQVKTAVSLGSGEIVAFDASQYYMTPMQQVPKPRLSPEQAKAKLSREVAVKSIRPALIPLPNGRDVLTYEVKASRDSTDYLIYVNASNGQEEMILQLVETEKGTLAI